MAFVGLSRRALRDLKSIEGYSVERWGKSVAADYIDSIEQGLNRLRENPGLLRSKEDISPHFSLYRVREHFLVWHRERESRLCVDHQARQHGLAPTSRRTGTAFAPRSRAIAASTGEERRHKLTQDCPAACCTISLGTQHADSRQKSVPVHPLQKRRSKTPQDWVVTAFAGKPPLVERLEPPARPVP